MSASPLDSRPENRPPDRAYRGLMSWRWALHVGALIFPLVIADYLATGPHEGWRAWVWLLLIVGFYVADRGSPAERGAPTAAPRWLFDAQLYLLVAVQIANLVGFVLSVRNAGLFTAHTAVAVILVGLNSGYSGITVAHELCHRPEKHMRFLARVLMVGVFYEHFTTEHVKGHHAKVGTFEDGATARHGEPFYTYLRRTIPMQFTSALSLDRRTVLQGVAASVLLAVLIGVLAGPGPLVAFAAQAAVAVVLLEAVNWFEHWGLTRTGKRPTTVDSWDAESRLTLYALVGLSRHADHHAHAARPYQELRHFEESPKLPMGYIALALTTLFYDRWVREQLDAQLRIKQLGPYRALSSA